MTMSVTAQPLTPDLVELHVASEQYYRFPGTNLTVCCLTLTNGHCVTGESCTGPLQRFREDVGREVAKRNAIDAAIPLLAYMQRELIRIGMTKAKAKGEA